MNYVIFDLDNCLANDEHRIGNIDWSQQDPDKRYSKYHAACGLDKPGSLDTYRAATVAARPVFFTARPITVRDATVAWLAQHFCVSDPLLFMRNIGDHRSSVELKFWMLEQLHLAVSDCTVTGAYDDREDVVAMYLEAGISACVLKLHDTCAYTKPIARAPELLDAAAKTFRERNAVYGDNYLRFGNAFLAIFPGNKLPPITTHQDMDRLQIMMQILNKLTRYAEQLHVGGHQDSARDMCVYAAMLEEVTKS